MKTRKQNKVKGALYYITIQRQGKDSGVSMALFIPDTATVDGMPNLSNGHIYAEVLGQLQKGFNMAA